MSQIARFRRTAAQVALPALAALALSAPTADAQARAPEPAASTITLPANGLPAPRPSGRPALAGKVDLSLNTFTWLDEQGLATLAPQDRGVLLALLREGVLVVTGRAQDRLAAAGPDGEVAVLVSRLQFFHTDVDGNTLAHARRMVDARLGDRSQYQGQPMVAGQMTQGQSMGAQPLGGLGQAQTAGRPPSEVGTIMRQQRDNVLWGVSSAVSNAASNAIWRIFNR